MPTVPSLERARLFLERLRQRLWVRPLLLCLLAIGAALVAKLADDTGLADVVPEVNVESVETLLSVMAASMLVIATFAVGSMVSAYASVSSTGTPRAFALAVADDVTQNALSTFIGAFIFSIVGLMAAKNDYFASGGRFVLFVLTMLVFAAVILTFVRWVDRIARLGRLGTTVERVEDAARKALARRRDAPRMHGVPALTRATSGTVVCTTVVGYVQHVDVAALQAWAEGADARVEVTALPGTLATPVRPLARVWAEGLDDDGLRAVREAFEIGRERRFSDDPRFGLVVLGEIAARALSPAVNDPGTAIVVIGCQLRLLCEWSAPPDRPEAPDRHDRVAVPELAALDMFDDAFTAIARDGAGSVEVAVRLQKALGVLAEQGNLATRNAAREHARRALARAEQALTLADDLAAVRAAAREGLPDGP